MQNPILHATPAEDQPFWQGPREQVHDVFAQLAERFPTRLAVIQGERRLTYQEVERRARYLAAILRSAHVAQDDVVAVLLDRSPEAVVALLAIFQCGAIALPLDVNAPAAQHAFQLQDAHAVLLLTHSRSQQQAQEVVQREALPLLVLDRLEDAPNAAHLSSSVPAGVWLAPHPPGGTATAVILYTSGTTGQPKGVLLPHRGILRLVRQTNYLHVSVSDRIMHGASLAFDASLFEIWSALLNGATLVIFSQQEMLAPSRFARMLQEHGITKLFLTSSLLHHYAWLIPEAFRAREVFFGGEAADVAAVRHLLLHGKPRRLVNLYGPTENSVLSTFYEISEPPAETATSVPIGTPISGSTAYLLDDQQQLIEQPGVIGELAVGGLGLALGYLNRPELTAERFILHPRFGRLYCTGDLARWLPGGALDFVGRRDRQLKLRGLRVEPEGIERLLCLHPAIRMAAVVARGQAEHTQLVAYLVPASADQPPSSADLQAFLAERLPPAIIPARFVLLSELPLTLQGKVDYRALASGKLDDAGTVLEPPAPRSDLEALLQRLYAQALDQPLSTVDLDTPSSLDSLALMVLASRLAEELQLPWKTMEALLPLLSTASVRQVSTALYAVLQIQKQQQQVLPPTLTTSQASAAGALPAFVSVEQRPLLPLIEAGEVPPVAVAALGYLPNLETDERRQLAAAWTGEEPLLSHLIDTPSGRIGLWILPHETRHLYSHQDALVASCLQALRQARQAGARVAALTGLLPSALGYGQTLLAALPREEHLPAITTGHSCTACAVVMNVLALLERVGRDLAEECLALIGTGSIGQTSLRLLLRTSPHPRRLLLCDPNADVLHTLARQVREEDGYQGALSLLPVTREGLPDVVYEANCIIGATNRPAVLDVQRLAPGTLVIDDSGPHCFALPAMLTRMQEQRDVLAIEGGSLTVPGAPLHELRYLPPFVGLNALLDEEELIALRHPHELMSCLAAGLLTAAWQLPPTIGLVSIESASTLFSHLQQRGWTAAEPHLTSNRLSGDLLEHMRSHAGRRTSTASELAR